jgi:guanylate kinase
MIPSGNLFVIAAPSGTGKTTLVKALVDTTAGIVVSISHTTRPKRPLEEHGINYYFIDPSQFHRMIEHHDFLEHATVFNHLYGTSRLWAQETLAKGVDVVLEIDWQGAKQIRALFPECISIFILPPSLSELEVRLRNRNQDHPEVIKQRLFDVRETMSHISDYDYLIVNADFDHALYDLKNVVLAGRLRKNNQILTYAKLLSDLTKIDTM